MVRLLTAGKSLVGSGNEGGGRYRVDKRRLLPKFESGNNPFSAVEVEAKPSSPPASNPQPIRSLPKETKATALPAIELPKRQLQQVAKLKSVNLSIWLEKLRAFTRRASSVLRRKPLASPPPRPVIQGELSLDRVRVVRNDLSDTDFEVVTARRTRPAVTNVPARLPEVERELVGTTMAGVTFRFFGAEET